MQINAFYRNLPNNSLSSNAQCLYWYLLFKNNELGWIKEFSVANSIVSGYTELSISSLQRARNELIQKGYINYKKGKSNKTGMYSINKLYAQNNVDFEQHSEQQNEQQGEQQNEHENDSTANTLNKQNKIKPNETNKKEKIKEKKPTPKKLHFGTFKNVLLTEQEHKNLLIDYGDEKASDYIERLSGYIASKGARYKSHYATIQNWARKDGVERWSKQNNIELTC